MLPVRWLPSARCHVAGTTRELRANGHAGMPALAYVLYKLPTAINTAWLSVATSLGILIIPVAYGAPRGALIAPAAVLTVRLHMPAQHQHTCVGVVRAARTRTCISGFASWRTVCRSPGAGGGGGTGCSMGACLCIWPLRDVHTPARASAESTFRSAFPSPSTGGTQARENPARFLRVSGHVYGARAAQVAVTLLGLWRLFSAKDAAYGSTLIWALVAVAVNEATPAAVRGVGIGCAALLGLGVVGTMLRVRRQQGRRGTERSLCMCARARVPCACVCVCACVRVRARAHVFACAANEASRKLTGPNPPGQLKKKKEATDRLGALPEPCLASP